MRPRTASAPVRSVELVYTRLYLQLINAASQYSSSKPELVAQTDLGVPEAFQGSRGESRERGIQGGGVLHERDILLCSVSFFVCVKNGYPQPSQSLRKIWYPPPHKPRQKRVPPPLSKRTTPPL